MCGGAQRWSLAAGAYHRAVADFEALRRRLRQDQPGGPPAGETPASVLVPIVARAGGCYLLLTRRTDGLTNHRGEIAFPGGRAEPGETSLDTALREAGEELGIAPADVEIFGALPGVGTNVSRFWVTPWVGALRNGAREGVVVNPAEVADLLEVPLATLTAPGVRREQRFIRGRFVVASPAFDTDAGTIWGATARIVAELLAALEP